MTNSSLNSNINSRTNSRLMSNTNNSINTNTNSLQQSNTNINNITNNSNSNNNISSSSNTNNSSSSNSLPKNNDWLLCAKWIDDCGCLPLLQKQRLLTNDLTLGEFANVLRDGEILCNLANSLLPGSIDITLINKRAHMSQMLCLKNIRLFLDACKNYFNLDESDLFDEHMLYEFDLARVIKALSILSRSKASSERAGGGFVLMSEQQNQQTNNNDATRHSSSNSSSSLSSSLSASNLNQNDDIYYNILPAEIESPESYYTDESFLFGNQSILLGGNDTSDNGVYQIIVQQPHSHQHQPPKRDFVIREILNTEENFIDGLNTLMNDFLIPLSKVLNDLDRKSICINIESLIKLHESLYADLSQACKGGQGRTSRICNVFDSFKLKLMKEYAEYFSCIDRALAKCDSLSNSHTNQSNLYSNTKTASYANEFRLKLEECRKTSKRGNFKLTDLLRLPYQRVLKYHLLFNELLKQTDVEHSAKDAIKKTRDSMCEVGNYLNECQRDKENLTQIEKISDHLTIDFKGTNNTSLKDYGHYIKDDKFRVKSIDSGERIARTRTFFLFEKALIVCKAKGEFYNYKEALLIDEYILDDPAAPTNSIQPVSPSGILSSVFDLTSSTSSSSLSVGGAMVGISLSSANAHNLVLYNSNRSKIYAFYFKSQEQKRVWKQALLQAKDKIQPKGLRNNKHVFMFTNFEHEMNFCCVCKNYLLGIFYQGYKCELCQSIAHKDCLIKTQICTVATPPPTFSMHSQSGKHPIFRYPGPPSSSHQQPQMPVITLERSSSSCSSKQQQSFSVRAIYRYDGRPPPPEFPVLIFNEGDLIQVTDDDDDEWWKGYLIKFKPNSINQQQSLSKEEGYFPSRHVKRQAGDINYACTNHTNGNNGLMSNNINSLNLEEYSWFARVDRGMADLILNRIPNPASQTIFMVRCRQEGGYAISIKYNGLVEHIKINLNYIETFTPPPPSNHQQINNLSSSLQHGLSLSSNGNSSTNNSNNNNSNTIESTNGILNNTTTTTIIYSIDPREFSSVPDLVKFYCQHTLKENFPQLETSLGIPYREALPMPVSIAFALHDYNPLTNPNNTGEQIEIKRMAKYFILNKEPNGWWRVYNSDGLIGYAPGGYLQEFNQ